MTFKNIYSYLKPGGKFIWSWGRHPVLPNVENKIEPLSVINAYFNEETQFDKTWSGSEGVYMQSRKISTWFAYLKGAGFRIVDFLEPQMQVGPNTAKNNTAYYTEMKAKHIPSTMIFVCEK